MSYDKLISAFTDMKGKFKLENLAKEFQYTKDTMGLSRNSNLQCNWKEFESDNSNDKLLKEKRGNISQKNNNPDSNQH